ncbi:AAA domain [Popillia japonica]|uniref:AAA domain n=1 Tax=Popillia japonica TaxID=7064 RepID=A0AAW1MEG1_POPJA
MNAEWSLKCICTEKIYNIDKPIFRLGRHREHDIVCSSVVISREHANFLLQDNKLFVKDLGSSNGTYINGRKVENPEGEVLKDQDVVSFGYPNHMVPCSQHKCFIYEVKDKSLENTTTDYIHSSHIKLPEAVNVNIKEEKDVPEIVDSNINQKQDDIKIKTENDSIVPMAWQPVQNVDNINNSVVKVESKTVIQNNEESYSVDDNVIVIDDDSDNNEISASQLFPLNDPFVKIKEELSKYDHVEEQAPVIVDSDDSIDFNILEILNDTPNVSSSVQNGIEENNCLEKIHLLIPNEHEKCNDENALPLNNDSTSTDRNETIATAIKTADRSSPIEINDNRTNPHILVKTTRNTKSKPKEIHKPPLKRRSTSPDKKSENKRQKLLSTTKIDVQPSTSGIRQLCRSRGYKSNVNTSLSKEDKLKIKEQRKQKLKKISIPAKDANLSKTSSSNLNSRPCVKISKSRGEFMLDEAIPINTRRKSVSTAQVTSKPIGAKKSAIKTRSASLSSEQPSTSNDPRFRSSDTFSNVATSNSPSTSNQSKTATATNVKSNIVDPLFNNNFLNSTRNGFFNRNSKEIAVSSKSTPFYNKQSFNDILNILNWKTQWLEEQKRLPSYPPVNKRAAVKMCNSFSSHNDYCNVVIPLLMIELWYELFDDWLAIDTLEKQAGRKFTCAIKEVENKPTYLTLKCTVYISKKHHISRKYVKENSIVILSVPMEKDRQHISQTLFGFVTYCEKRPIKEKDSMFDYLVRQVKPDVPYLQLSLQIIIKATPNKICLNKPMDGAVLISVVTALREFDAVYNLGSSLLSKFILDPKVEDYRILPNEAMNEDKTDTLNEVQEKVISEASQLCLGDSPGIYLVQGPPGTGKTTVIKNIVKKVIVNSAQKVRLLLTAPSNSAIDSLVIKIVKELKAGLLEDEKRKIKLVRVGPWNAVNDEIKPYLLDQFAKVDVTKTFLNENPAVRRDFNTLHNKKNKLKAEIEVAKELGSNIDELKGRLTAVEQEYESFAKNYMKQKYAKALDTAKRRIYDGSNIVCTTLSSCARLLELNRSRIDCCIVDEATQSKEAETLIPLLLGVTKLILVGDPQQLPAVVISPDAKHLECGQSLFQRIKKVFNHNPENPIRMLNVQHRMHPEISVFPNNEFYRGEHIEYE